MLENQDDRLGEVPIEPLLSDDPERARRRGTGTGLDPFFSGDPLVAGVVAAGVAVGVVAGVEPFVFAFAARAGSFGCSMLLTGCAGAGLFCGVDVTLSMTLSTGPECQQVCNTV